MIEIKDLAIILLLLLVLIMGLGIGSMQKPRIQVLRYTVFPEAVEKTETATRHQHIIEYIYNGEYRIFKTFYWKDYKAVLKYLGVK